MKQKKRKVLFVSNCFPNNYEPHSGIWLKQIADRVKDHCEIRVVSPVPWFPFRWQIFGRWAKIASIHRHACVDGIEINYPRWIATPKIFLWSHGFSFFLGILFHIIKIKRSFDFDIINTFWVYPDGYASIIVGKLLKVPTIVGALGSDLNDGNTFSAKRRILSWTLRNSDFNLAVTEELKKKITGLGVDKDKTLVIPNGVNADLFKPMDKRHCRKKLDIPLESTIILYVGNLQKEKGGIYLLKAFNHLIHKKSNNNNKLVLVGSGPLQEEFQYYVREKRIDQHIIFAGAQPHSQIPVWINSCDVFCLPSISEGCPNVLLEALACGKPVVASNVGGVPEILYSEELGYLVEAGDVKGLSNELEKAIIRRWNTKLIQNSIKGRTWESKVEEMVNVYEYVISKRGC